ncbi:MAG TPA: putative zinc-binding metallopeptidase, partial [Thermoanaerobaculia bacterium]
MATRAPAFQEAPLGDRPIRDLGLGIQGTELEPVIAELEGEIAAAGIRRVRPRFYLSTEWGVPFGTVAIAIPFYLARPELTALHAERTGHVEGAGRRELLRYLRHEMGHVVNYAYRLYDRERWVQHFGPITRPYREEYRPKPFSRRYVRHLPGWYAQKHPDEDWAETFAVWMDASADWRALYGDAPGALKKLEYCDRVCAELKAKDPLVSDKSVDEDVSTIRLTVQEFYADGGA